MTLINQNITRLNTDELRALISDKNHHAIGCIEMHQTLPSTNLYCLEKGDISAGFICFSAAQTQGRGRLNKTWYSPPVGNLYFSFCYAAGTKNYSALSLVVGLSLQSALQKICSSHAIKIKWPNDLYAQNKKLAGILIEGRKLPNGQQGLIIGIGINFITPGEPMLNAIGLRELTEDTLSQSFIAAAVIDQMLTNISLFELQGLAPFLPAWPGHDYLWQKAITVLQNDKKYSGIAMGIDQQGALQLRTQAGKQSFVCGEVSVKPNDSD